MHNSFLPPEDQNEDDNDNIHELNVSDLVTSLMEPPSGDSIELAGIRMLPTNIKIKMVVDHNPSRDAALLDVILSTSLNPQTYQLFSELICRKYLNQIMVKEAAQSLTNIKTSAVPPPPAPPKPKKRPKKEDDTTQSEDN